MPVPSTAHIQTSTGGPVTWSDGSNFDGYLLLGIAPPTNSSGTTWPNIALQDSVSRQKLPLWTAVQIQDGKFNQNTTVFFSNNIQPRNCQYVAYWYDANWQRIYPAIGTPPSFFTITSDPYLITVPTLSVPTLAVTVPTPLDNSNASN